ncbi:E3 ubiquitin-protein ligase listerin-like protein, partial [Rozella allomycis CSF55]
QVVAKYTIDDVSMEIQVNIPLIYPLRQVTVEGGKRAGVNEGKWRQWLLVSQTAITSQNLSILDALLLWKNNADKRFEGIDDCPICYSVIHITDKSLPSQMCKTCKNKFHGPCLFKWFKSSAQSSCPLCRSLF